MTRLHTTLGILALASAACSACSKTQPEPEKTSEPPAARPATAVASVSTTVAPAASKAEAPSGPEDIAWDAPKSWQSVPNANTMRKATYKIAKVGNDSEDAELTVSSAGGGVDANIKRWAGQFGNANPKTEDRNPNGLKVTVVEIKGTYASGGGMMGGPSTPKGDYMLLGAVVEGGDNRLHFFKMTGPEKTVTAAKKDFDALVASFRAK